MMLLLQKPTDWNEAMKVLSKSPDLAPDKEWYSSYQNLDKVFIKLKPYLDHEEFTEEFVSKQNTAAAILCRWVI